LPKISTFSDNFKNRPIYGFGRLAPNRFWRAPKCSKKSPKGALSPNLATLDKALFVMCPFETQSSVMSVMEAVSADYQRRMLGGKKEGQSKTALTVYQEMVLAYQPVMKDGKIQMTVKTEPRDKEADMDMDDYEVKKRRTEILLEDSGSAYEVGDPDTSDADDILDSPKVKRPRKAPQTKKDNPKEKSEEKKAKAAKPRANSGRGRSRQPHQGGTKTTQTGLLGDLGSQNDEIPDPFPSLAAGDRGSIQYCLYNIMQDQKKLLDKMDETNKLLRELVEQGKSKETSGFLLSDEDTCTESEDVKINK